MSSIIVVFPKNGDCNQVFAIYWYEMDLTCWCGGNRRHRRFNWQIIWMMEFVVCGYKMKDMLYNELRDYLPGTIEMLLIASPEKCSDRTPGVISLSMPFKVFDLMNTIEMMAQSISRRRKKRKSRA